MSDYLMLHPNWINIIMYPERYDMKHCDSCNGSGISPDDKHNCRDCNGSGVVGKNVKIKNHY